MTAALDTAPPHRALGRLVAVGRILLVSLVCLVLGAAFYVVLWAANVDTYGQDPPRGLQLLLLADLIIGAVANIAAGPMRRAGVWNLLLAASGALSASSMPAVVVGLVRLGRRRDVRLDIAGTATCALAALAYSTLERWGTGAWSGSVVFEILLATVLGAAALLWGRMRGTRAALITSLRHQASTAHRERAAIEREHDALAREHRALVAQAEAEQRAAIARDMHDSLSHHLSLIAMHAGALSYRQDMPPERMRDVATTIHDDARAANTELRHVLGALREDGAEPLPTAAHLGELIETARAEGQDVEMLWEGTDAAELDAEGSATVVTLVRIVRELITNARKHAPDSPLSLRLSRSEDGEGLHLSARNPLAGPSPALGTGWGLTGVRERVRLLGGSFEATEHDDTFAVDVHLPWRSR
ncbi:sensor histidine kinase [Brachybacterium endophyticum]|nr:histidine kinase [Brachybacterium endophyticum]